MTVDNEKERGSRVSGESVKRTGPRLSVVPVPLWLANEYLSRFHRHNGPLPGAKMQVVACLEDGTVVGVAVAGHPKSMNLGDYGTLEVSRVCTDGTYNACSKLYGACVRAARALGYWRCITYTLEREAGTSLLASGWANAALSTKSNWDTHPRAGRIDHDTGPKHRWEIVLKDCGPDLAWPSGMVPMGDPSLFDDDMSDGAA